jgi:hypothetical protein
VPRQPVGAGGVDVFFIKKYFKKKLAIIKILTIMLSNLLHYSLQIYFFKRRQRHEEKNIK